jgi:transcriptional regulator with XRE-family HTH domain
MDQSKPPSLAELVGRNVRAAREEIGMSQDLVARLLRGYGLNWTRSALAKFERGERDTLTVEQLVALSLALMRTPDSLVEGAEWVTLGPDSRMRGSALVRLLRGEREAWGNDDDFDVPFWREAIKITQRVPGKVSSSFDVWRLAAWSAGDAEARAARRLGRKPVEVARAAYRLWGRSLVAERDHRLQLDEGVGARSLPALRGHVTRQLLDELRTELEDGSRGEE